MKLYKKYLEEKYGRKLIEDEHGFIEYKKFNDNSVYIYTLFVSKEARNQGLGHGLELRLIEKENPISIYCDIDLNSNGAEIALSQIIKKANYKVYSASNDKIILFKELNNG